LTARRLLVLAVAAVAIAGVAGCSDPPAPHDPSPAQVVASLGAVPIPSAGPAVTTPTAVPGRPAVLAIGGPVRVTLPGGSTVLATALGPRQVHTAPARSATRRRPPDSTKATITLRLQAVRGDLIADAGQLSSRDETGKAVALTPRGATRVHARPGLAQTLTVGGTFPTGAAQVTWRSGSHVLAVWTFNIELD
jgi:hypothetical protein